MNTKISKPKLTITLSRPISQNKSSYSEQKSLKSMDKLYISRDNGRVYSEKCLINQKNYLKFKGNLKSLKSISTNKKNKKNKLMNNSCDKINHVRSVGNASKSGFYSSTHLDNSDKNTNDRAGNHSQPRY